MKKKQIEPVVDEKDPQDYEVKDAADTLMRAEEIKGNKKLMPHVHKHMEGKKKHIDSIAALKDHAQAVLGKADEPAEAEIEAERKKYKKKMGFKK